MRPEQGEQDVAVAVVAVNAGRRRKRSDGQRTVLEQRRCYFRMKRRGRPSLVVPKIKGERTLERRGTDGKARMERTSVADDDDDSVCLTWRESSLDRSGRPAEL